MSSPVVEIVDASVEFQTPGGTIRAMDKVTLTVNAGETVAVVGESGCGKTTLARAVLGLQPLHSGKIELRSEAVAGISKGLAEKVGMVWQDPYASLDPRWTVGKSATEPASITHRKLEAAPLFEEVGLDPSFVTRFPHQMSGGQRQRVAIARAIALRPPLLICDEPTAALDLSIRAQILNLLKKIQSDVGCAILYISHDLMTVRFLADRIAVMYLGQLVEEGPTEEVFSSPKHPYTKALLDSAPTLDKLRQLPEALPGEIPDPRERIPGCKFAPRCIFATDECRQKAPEQVILGSRSLRCYHPINN